MGWFLCESGGQKTTFITDHQAIFILFREQGTGSHFVSLAGLGLAIFTMLAGCFCLSSAETKGMATTLNILSPFYSDYVPLGPEPVN